MRLASTRLIVSDITAAVSFYEPVTETAADWLAPVFAETVTPGATLAIGATETVVSIHGRNRHAGPTGPRYSNLWSMISMQSFHALRAMSKWCTSQNCYLGAITFQFRDPEGTLVSLFMPATEEARARLGSR